MSEVLRALIVDDDPAQLDLISRRLKLEGFEVQTSGSAFGASNLIRSFVPHVVLLDVNIPALSGDRLLSIARRVAAPETRFVLYSACDESKLRALAKETEADDWISKSTEMSLLAARLRRICATPHRKEPKPEPA